MAHVVRVLIYNSDEAYGASMRSSVLHFEGVKIVAEVDEAVLLPQAVERFPCDVLIANLDPVPEMVMPALREVHLADAGLPIFAISESTDGQLILSAMRQGIREFVTKPIDSAVLEEAFEKIASQQTGEQTQGSLITVIGGAGGVGASTLAVNLAVELNQLTEGTVAVVDLDHRFGQVATLLDVDPTYTLADLCESPEQVEQQLIERALVTHSSGTRILSRPLHFAQADSITAAHCVGVLTALASMNDYVVVDGPTRFDYGAKAVLDVADYNLIVLHPVVPAVRSVHRMLQGMKEIGFNLDRMKIVINRAGSDNSGISAQDIQATLNLGVFAEIPDDWVSVNAAVNMGEPLARSSPKSKVRLALKAMALRLHAPDGAVPEPEHKKGGLLSKLF